MRWQQPTTANVQIPHACMHHACKEMDGLEYQSEVVGHFPQKAPLDGSSEWRGWRGDSRISFFYGRVRALPLVNIVRLHDPLHDFPCVKDVALISVSIDM